MKKHMLLIFLICLCIVACQNKPQRYFEASAEIETVKACLEAYENQDWESWELHYADTAKIYLNTNYPISVNKMVENMQKNVSYFSSYAFSKENSVYEMVIDKDGKTWVNFWSSWSGQTKITDKHVVIPVHITLEFINGKIAQEYAYYDTAITAKAIQEIELKKMENNSTVSSSQ